MNDSRGVRPEIEHQVLTEAGEAYAGFIQHPKERYGPDAWAPLRRRFVEVRTKDCSIYRCEKPFDPDDPRSVGVMIGVEEVKWHNETFDLLVKDEFNIIWRADIDPATVAKYYRREGRNVDGTKYQECYFIPIEEFYFIAAGRPHERIS